MGICVEEFGCVWMLAGVDCWCLIVDCDVMWRVGGNLTIGWILFIVFLIPSTVIYDFISLLKTHKDSAERHNKKCTYEKNTTTVYEVKCSSRKMIVEILDLYVQHLSKNYIHKKVRTWNMKHKTGERSTTLDLQLDFL